MGGSRTAVLKDATPKTRKRYRLVAHICTRTHGCRNYVQFTTPPYESRWLPWGPPNPTCCPPWTPGFVPTPSNGITMVFNSNNAVARNFYLSQTLRQRQQTKSPRMKQLIDRLIRLYFMRPIMRNSLPPALGNTSVSVESRSTSTRNEDPAASVQECVMIPAKQEQHTPAPGDLPSYNFSDVNDVPLQYLEILKEEPKYNDVVQECVMSPEKQEFSSEKPEDNYEPPEYDMSSEQQEQEQEMESNEDVDVYSVPSPAMEVTINDINNNEEDIANRD